MKFYLNLIVFISLILGSFVYAEQHLYKVLPKNAKAESLKHNLLLSQDDFSITTSFNLNFLRFNLPVSLVAYFNRYGELDFDYIPDEKALTLFARNFRSHKVAHNFLLSAVNNIAFQMIANFLKESSKGSLARNLPSSFVFSALKQMVESSESIVRRDESISTYTNRVYKVQLKYLLGDGVRKGDQEVKLVARIQANRVINALEQLGQDTKDLSVSSQKEINGLIKFFTDFKRKAENQPRSWKEKPIGEKILSSKATRKINRVYENLKNYYVSHKVKALLSQHKAAEIKNYDWYKSILDKADGDMSRFVSNYFLKMSSIGSFENYAIKNRGNFEKIKKEQPLIK